ncbi:hypothetical protein F5Y15DRAFT_423627 [Xylariaceae sp. FL0016]|nr:hypothetical protein F5Y15DRAFT_423627 [Xylariaceae sp. FL0016]
MKLSAFCLVSFSATVHLAQGLSLPRSPPGLDDSFLQDLRTGASLSKSDDEWTMELYDTRDEDGSCSGPSSKNSNGSDSCVNVNGKNCAQLEVTAGLSDVASCYFNFRHNGEDCSGDSQSVSIVQGGTNAVLQIAAGVQFVSIDCVAGG